MSAKIAPRSSLYLSSLRPASENYEAAMAIQRKYPNVRRQIIEASHLFSDPTKREKLLAGRIAYHQIFPNLYLGSRAAIESTCCCLWSKFDYYLKVTKKECSIPQSYPPFDDGLPLFDIGQDLGDTVDSWDKLVENASDESGYYDLMDVEKMFSKAFTFIDRALLSDKKIVIFCKKGRSRSAAVLIAYLINRFNVNFYQAYFFIKSKRACIAPNSGFKIGLREYERVLRERIPPAIYMKPTLCTLL
jgi:hypothetical protein